MAIGHGDGMSAADVSAAIPPPEDILPPISEQRPIARLRAALRRIDGWGPVAWREILGAWRFPHGVLVVTVPEDGAEDERIVWLVIDHALRAEAPVATADWVLRAARATVLPTAPVRLWTLDPGSDIRPTTACFFLQGRLHLRLHVDLPYLGMCLDAKGFGRLVRRLEGFAADLAEVRSRPTLQRQRRTVAVAQALRAALPTHGLVAFAARGARLPRTAGSKPLRLPAALATTIDLGRLGRITGWGIRAGVTVITGAPYHGKSTVLQALQAGICDHPPGDGRERVVADPSALLVQAEDGRAVRHQDLTPFFARLPGCAAHDFSTARASGATSMAASVLQGTAAGCRLLLVDEDSAASNFMLIDPVMRRLLGKSLHGTRTLLEVLPDLARQGVSTILVAGSNGHALTVADQVVAMVGWQPEVVRRPRLLRLPQTSKNQRILALPQRTLQLPATALFGYRNFVPLDLREPERPRLKLPPVRGDDGWRMIDLRRSGWVLDAALVAGAIQAAAWCCRLGSGLPLAEVGRRYAALSAAGPAALDPFHSTLLAVPPWQLVVTVLERLPWPASVSRPS